MSDFQNYYPLNPWEAVETRERQPYYFPRLYQEYAKRAIYNRFVQVAFNHNGPKATELVVSNLMMPHTNHDPIGLRQQWLDTAHMDTYERRIRFRRYGNKMSLNRYDDMVTYWESNQGAGGLIPIIRNGLGHMITQTMEKVARDAYLLNPSFALYGNGAGGSFSGSSFADVTSDSSITTELLHDIRLGLAERYIPIADEEQATLGGDIICVTSPGVVRDLRFEADQTAAGRGNTYIETKQYADPRSIITGEVGTYAGVRFLQHPDATLYNAGNIIHRASIIAPVNPGDGSPDPETEAVDGVEYVGQRAATHHILVDDASGFRVGERVTIHVRTTDKHGVVDGVDYQDGKLINMRIVKINGNQVSFERPVLEPFVTDLGGGVYGYITKGTNIHTMLFLNSRDGVVMGVAQPMTIHTPRPVDDLDMIQRFSFDGYMGMNPFNKNAFEVVYLAGSNREVGPRYRR